MKSRYNIFIALLLSACSLFGCVEPEQEIPVSVRLNKEMISSLSVGASQTLLATVMPKGTEVSLVWASDKEDVAVVDDQGKVTGVTPGTAVISVTADEAVATCEVTVVAVKAEKIALDPKEIELVVDQQQVLEVVFTPAEALASDLEWSVDKSSVATVDNKGKVTAKSAGTCVVIAKCNKGKLAAACQVTVVDKEDGGNDDGGNDDTVVEAESMELDPSTLALKVGNEWTIRTVFHPENATVTDLEWKTSDATVATVENGKVKAIKEGAAVITATCNGGKLSATCEVAVSEPDDEDLSIESVTLYAQDGITDVQVGKTLQLNAVYEPTGAVPTNVSWTIDRPEAADVNQNGLVTGKSAHKGDRDWDKVNVTVTADDKSSTITLRVIPVQPESIEVDLPEDNQLRVGEVWDFNPRVIPEGLGYGVTCSIMKPGNNFTADQVLSSDKPGTIAAQFAVASHENLVYGSYRRDVNVSVIPYWVESVTLPESQDMEVGGSIILSPEFTSDVEGVQPTSKALVWTSSDETKAVVDNNGKVTALASGTVEITATTSDYWSVPSGQPQKSATCIVTIVEAQFEVKVGDFYYSDGTTSPTLLADKTVIGIVISRDNATSTDKKLPAECTHGVVLALGEGSGIWSSSYDAGRVNTWATQNGYENTTGTYYSQWTYMRNEYGNKLLGYNNTCALKEYIKNNGYTSGILDALEAYEVTLPETASELYIPSIAEMDAVAKNLEVINAALKAAGGTEFIMDTIDNQKDAYWTTSENEASSGNAATINPFTGELHGGVMKSKEKKVRFIFAF